MKLKVSLKRTHILMIRPLPYLLTILSCFLFHLSSAYKELDHDMIELTFEQYPSQVADVLINAANDTGMIVIGINDTRLIYDMLLLEEKNLGMYSVEEWACGILVGNHSKPCLDADELPTY